MYVVTSAEIENGDYIFKAAGSRMKFEGYLKIYNDSSEEDEDKMLPPLSAGEKLFLIDLKGEQNFTQPPSRFTEASLVKDMEDKNIGRPSTYAPIMATLIERKYINREKKNLIPTDLGFLVTELMEKYFPEVADTSFTAGMEDRLDSVEVEHTDWTLIIKEFYDILSKELEVADRDIERVKLEDEVTDEKCELCGKPMVIKRGRFGEFLACSGYPECKNTKPKVNKINIKCPRCGRDIVARKSKTGKLFFGCSGYPECNQLYWNKPVEQKCPKCGSLLTEKKTKTTKYVCSNADCGYKE